MTEKERRERIKQLHALAAQRHLELVRREQTRGRWVWDAVDTRSGQVAARGMRLEQLELYLHERHRE